MATTEDRAWIHETCLAWRGDDPAALLEELMSDERCDTFGPCIISWSAPRSSPAHGRWSGMMEPVFPTP